MLYAATIVYLALIYVRPNELIEGWAEVQLVAIASAATAPLLGWAMLEGRSRLWELPQDRLLWAFWIVIVISNPSNGYLGGATFAVTSFAQVVFQYVLIRTAIRTPGQLRGAIFWLTVFMLFHALSGIQQVRTGIGFGGVEPLITEAGEVRIRSVGIFNDPNDLALSMVVVIPFLVMTILSPGAGGGARGMALITMVPMLMAYFFTNSRGGVLGLGAALTIIGWRRYGPRLGTTLIVIGLLGVVALGPSRLAEMDAEEDSAQGRIQAWAEGLAMLRSRPLFGVGYGMWTEHHPLVAHNSFVQVLGELGLAGGAAFFGMTYWYFAAIRRVAALPKVAEWPFNSWQVGFTAMGAAFFVSVFFLSRQYNPVLLTVIALGASYVSVATEGQGTVVVSTATDRKRVIFLTLGAVVALSIIVRVFGVFGA